MYPAQQIPQMEGCSVEEVSKVLKEAAALHKSYWNDEKLLSYSWLTYGISEEEKNLLLIYYHQFIQNGKIDIKAESDGYF